MLRIVVSMPPVVDYGDKADSTHGLKHRVHKLLVPHDCKHKVAVKQPLPVSV